jgi:hypothetical protein
MFQSEPLGGAPRHASAFSLGERNPMSSSSQTIRLTASIVFSALSAWFVVIYTRMSFIRFESDHADYQGLIRVNDFMVRHSHIGWLIPVGAAACAVLATRSGARREVLQELIIQIVWIAALAWAALPLLFWQVQNIPIVSGGRWHY